MYSYIEALIYLDFQRPNLKKLNSSRGSTIIGSTKILFNFLKNKPALN